MTENRGPHPQPSGPPSSQPPEDDIRWLVYLAVGFVVTLALLLLSGLHASHMGH